MKVKLKTTLYIGKDVVAYGKVVELEDALAESLIAVGQAEESDADVVVALAATGDGKS